ncbi:HD domain-containing protein [Allofustis seminis]|uniref:HD domain-containing protein n=1 Tax=Allofustis seminis TaxID=166939 RepID=UPI00037B4742|nr:HD domain-containing protein [Allofustis seminis]
MSELSNKPSRTQPIVFKDPVHDYIHVDDRLILQLIDSKEFQRLRRIKQLGTSQYTFHGAEHSRFSHSLGVYELTRLITDRFARYYAHQWDSQEQFVALCAALLHDIGHGPFSHTFEKIFKTDHEAITQQIILNPATQVHHILQHAGEDFPAQVASVIAKTYPNPQVVQLISSQMDADRMDYLLRDAYFTGVSYGNFDLSRILRVIRPYTQGIAFSYAGMHAVEDYVVSRYQMYMQVYFHPVSRGMEVTLDRLLTRAKDLYLAGQLDILPPFLEPFFDNHYTLHDYLALDDAVLITAIGLFCQSKDTILSTLAQMFYNRKPLKSVEFDGKNQTEIVEKLRHLVEKAGYPLQYFTQINRSSDLSYDYSLKGQSPIILMNPDDSLVELSTASPIVKILSDHLHGNQRLYVPAEFLSTSADIPFDVQVLRQQFLKHIHNGHII